MYIVCRSSDEKYGNVIAILRAEEGEISPFFAAEEAKREKRLWQEQETAEIRFVVDNQVMTVKQLETWVREEYKSLPKCNECAKILHGEVYASKLTSGNLYCSQLCADNNDTYQADHLKDYEEFDL